MANTVFKLRRSSVAGKVPTTTDITIGELALNLTDRKLYSSDGSNTWELGANLSSLSVGNSTNKSLSVNSAVFAVNTDINFATNNKKLSFTPLAGGSNVYFVQQNDDNFVFATTYTNNAARPVFAIYANSATSNLSFLVPLVFNSTTYLGSTALSANGSTGTAGQVLSSNGSATYWVSPTIAATNTNAQFVWTNTHVFQSNITFTGNNISVLSNTGSVLFAGNNDANWKIGRNTGGTTKFFYTGNTLDVIAANSSLEGIAFGWTGDSYLETGYAGTFTRLPIYVGNSSVNVSINSTSFSGTANNADYLDGQHGVYYTNATNISSGTLPYARLGVNVVNTTSAFTLSGVITHSANVVLGSSGLSANGSYGSAGQSLLSNGSATYWATAGATLNANNTDTQTFYIGLSNATSGAWTNAVVSTTKLYYVPSTGVLDATIVNASSHTVGTAFTANATVVNAVSYYAGSTLIGNTTGPYGKTEINLNVNNSVTSNTASYLGNSSGTTANFVSWISGNAATAYTNAVSYTDSKILTANAAITGNAATAYTNAVSYVDGLKLDSVTNTSISYIPVANTVKNAYDRAIDANTRAASAQTAAAAAYTNSVSYVDGKILTANAAITGNAATAYTNAVSYTDGKILTANAAITGNAATAYSNAITFASNATNINTGTLAEARLPYRMNQNLTTSNDVTFGSMTLTGSLSISGNVNVVGANTLSVVDNFIYLNSNNTIDNEDIGIVGNYNTTANSLGYAHTGIFRDASDGTWKIFDNYTPEPDANVNIDTTNTSFHVANFQANTLYLGNTSTNWLVSNTSGVYHTGTVNAASHTVGTSTISNSSGVYATTINAASYTVGTSTIANATGVYTTTVNAASYTVGTAFTANSTLVNAVSLVVSTNTSTFGTAMYVAANGNVGIGNSTPSYKFQIEGARPVYFSTALGNIVIKADTGGWATGLNFQGGGGTDRGGFGAYGANDALSYYWMGSVYNGSNNAVLTYAGNFGIGNNSPSDKLTVNGTSYITGNVTALANVFVTNVVNAASYSVGTAFTANSTLVNAVSLVVSTNTSTFGTAAYVVANGNVGIGTNAPAAKLDVNGSIRGSGLTINTTGIIAGANQTTIDYLTSRSRVLGWGANTTTRGALTLGVLASDASLYSEVVYIDANTNVGVGTTTPSYKLQVNGSFAAVTKSFVIDHPSVPGKKLRYASLEGPENGVYVRGKLDGNKIIELPDYWKDLVDSDTITVNLTPIGRSQNLYVVAIDGLNVHIDSEDNRQPYCFYHVYAERKDVPKLVVEFDA